MSGSAQSTNTATDSPDVQMTIESGLAHAVRMFNEGQHDQAESVLQQILEQQPDEPNTLNMMGLLCHRQGRNFEAVDWLRRAVELVPGAVGPWLNLGNVLIESERFVQAIQPLERALRLDANSADVHNNLGLAYLHADRLADSDAAFRKGLELDADRADLHFNYARMLRIDGRRQEAITHSIRSLEIDPSFSVSRHALCVTYFELGEVENAAAALAEWQAREPDSPQIKHLQAAIGQGEIPTRAADDYVAEVFDDFADTFDEKLAMLNYRAPQMVANALGAVIATMPDAPHILDAGCGTGLCGPLVRHYVGRLVGVDLSQGMLQRAQKLKVYDVLDRAELTQYMADVPASYDAIISADTLCYFGTLEEVLSRAHRALRINGCLIFTVEASADTEKDYSLQIEGRYKHSKNYLLKVLRSHNFAVAAMQPETLRMELEERVRGWVVTAIRIDEVKATAATDDAAGS